MDDTDRVFLFRSPIDVTKCDDVISSLANVTGDVTGIGDDDEDETEDDGIIFLPFLSFELLRSDGSLQCFSSKYFSFSGTVEYFAFN